MITVTKLKCNVTSCSANEDNCCCRPSIAVSGHRAERPNETCCASYRSKQDRKFAKHRYDFPDPKTEIECSAEACIFNNSRICCAGDVCIDCCPDGTSECASFRELD